MTALSYVCVPLRAMQPERPPKPAGRMRRVTVAFTDEQYAYLVSEARRLRVSVSAVVGQIVAERMAAQCSTDDAPGR